jgi:hypothetical protein
VQFQTRTQQPSASEPANASSIGMAFITLLFPQRPIPALAFTLNLAFAEEILVNHPMETSPPQHASSPRAKPSFAQVEILSSSGTQSPPSHTEVLTPKFGKESDLWVQSGEKSVRKKEGFFRRIQQKSPRSAICFRSARKLLR